MLSPRGPFILPHKYYVTHVLQFSFLSTRFRLFGLVRFYSFILFLPFYLSLSLSSFFFFFFFFTLPIIPLPPTPWPLVRSPGVPLTWYPWLSFLGTYFSFLLIYIFSLYSVVRKEVVPPPPSSPSSSPAPPPKSFRQILLPSLPLILSLFLPYYLLLLPTTITAPTVFPSPSHSLFSNNSPESVSSKICLSSISWPIRLLDLNINPGRI